MATAVVAVEGVLRQNNKVIGEGRRLIASLSQQYRVVLALDDAETDRLHHWLRLEGINEHQEVLAGDHVLALRGADPRVAQVEALRGRGEHVTLVVDHSPDRIAALMKYGITSLLFVDPGLQRPEYRPDYDHSPRPWGDLVAEIEMARYHQAGGGIELPSP